MNQSIQQIAADMSFGENTRDNVLKEEVVRRIIYTETGALSVGEQLVGSQELPQLAIDFTYPNEMSAEYPVAQTTRGPRQDIEWSEFRMRLQRGQTRYFVSDDAMLEGMADIQQNTLRRRASEALARRKDENIMSTLVNGAYDENEDTKGAGEEWNAADGPDLVDELWAMWQDILVNAPLNSMDIQNFAVVLPVEVWTEVNRIELINNIQQRVRDYLGQTFGFSIYPTKLGMHDDDEFDMQDTALMMIPGEETALHGILSAETARSRGVPLVEQKRIEGRGIDYYISQWFNTGVKEHETGNEGESPRIAVRNNVNVNA